jgi:uncharacterized membrane protein
MRYFLGSVGWGVTIYALMYLLWSGLVMYDFATGFPSLILRLAALLAITAFAARSLHLHNWRDLLPYALSWALCSIALDALFLVPFSGWALYATWSVWAGYSLVVLFPLVTSQLSFRRARSVGSSVT